MLLIVNFTRPSISKLDPLEEIDIQLKNRLDRKRSIDTTSGGSNVTVIEGNLLEEVADHGDSCNTNELSDIEKQFCDDSVPQTPSVLPSCLYRHDSVRASIKKKVRCSDAAAEVIPVAEYSVNSDDYSELYHDDDDDVFSDSAPVQTSRGNMCTPYIERKGSLPGLEVPPGWFPNSRLLQLKPKNNLF